MSAGTFYQVIKDLFEGGEKRRIAGFSVAQMDLTIDEIDRRLQTDIDNIRREGDLEQGRFIAKVGASGCTLEGSPSDVLHSMQAQVQRQTNERRAEANYVKKMLMLEKDKAGVVLG